MDVQLFKLENHTFPGRDYNVFIHTQERKVALHSHDFYEIFITAKGGVSHIVNNTKQELPAGSLVFIRPLDTHTILMDDKNDFMYINLNFSKETAALLFEYLGDDNLSDILLSSKLPPMRVLGNDDKIRVLEKLKQIVVTENEDKKAQRLIMRSTLADILVRYFTANTEKDAEKIPFWLETACEKMKKQSNFNKGMTRMVELSGKSVEHLCRSMAKFKGTTPAKFINDVRLSYVASMLINSDLPVTDLWIESGFQSAAYFYKIFNEKFGVTPKKYRETNTL